MDRDADSSLCTLVILSIFFKLISAITCKTMELLFVQFVDLGPGIGLNFFFEKKKIIHKELLFK